MPLNILEVQDAWISADIKHDIWLEEYIAQFEKPLIDMAVGTAFHNMPEEAKKILKKMDPQAYEEMVQKYGGE